MMRWAHPLAKASRSLEVVEQVSLAAVVLALPVGNALAPYVTALIANICQAGFIFVRFVGSAFRHENDILGS